jgi:hypothetical protein
MRLPRVRFTVRRMMIALVILGVLMWGYTEHRRSKERSLAEVYWQRAEHHRKLMEYEIKSWAGVRARIARGDMPYPYRPRITSGEALAGMDRQLRYRKTTRRRNLYAMEYPLEYTPPREDPNRDFAWTLASPAPWELESNPWETSPGDPQR